MMNYENFREAVKEKFMDYMPEQYQDYELKITPVNKVNETLDGLMLTDRSLDVNVSPTVYVNEMYKKYQECGDMEYVIDTYVGIMKSAMNRTPDMVSLDYEKAADRIVFQLINTRQNQALLDNAPHRPFHDLSVIYRWVISEDSEGIASTVVTNSIAKNINMSEEELYAAAMENTKKILPPVVKNIASVINEIITNSGMPEDMTEEMIQEMAQDAWMYVITNSRGLNGASAVLYEDNLHELSLKLDSDLYLIPSSVHEFIAVSTDMGEPDELASLVVEVNMNNLELSERLSNQVYRYDRETREITPATDTPNKSLEGPEQSRQAVYRNKER